MQVVRMWMGGENHSALDQLQPPQPGMLACNHPLLHSVTLPILSIVLKPCVMCVCPLLEHCPPLDLSD